MVLDHGRGRSERSEPGDGETDKEDYFPPDTVIITGAGWDRARQ